MTVNDLTVAGDSGDLEISSPIDEINVDGDIQSNISNEKALQSDNAINNGEKLSASNGDVLSEDYDYVITPQSLREYGLDSQIESGNFKFEGVFDGDDFFPYFMFQDCVVDASEATFVNMGIILNGNVQISGLTLTASRYVDDQEFATANGALVYVTSDDNVLDGLNIQYAPDEGYDAYGIVFDQANNFQLLNSVIEFTGPNYGDYYEYAMKIDHCQGTNIVRGNKITANLPILAVDYSAGNPGLDTDRVLNTGIRDSSVDIINNRFYANVIGSDNNYPTLDCLMLESCEGVNIIDNVFEETDFITPEGEANYLNVVDLYYSNHVLVKGNKISVETNGGSENAGTSYPIQLTGPYENVVIDGNDLYAHCGGPALGIFSQNYYGDTEILVQNNNIDVTGLPTDHSWGLVSGIELQDTYARVYNNDIKTKSILGYVEDGMNIYGISYAQYLNDNHNYEIVGNTIETEGQYAIYLLKAQDTTVNNNNLLSGAGEGDDAVYIQEEVGSTEIRDNNGRGNFYVSPNGDDGNSGSEDSPLQNIITAMVNVPAGGKIILLEGEHVIDHQIDIEKSVSIIGENPENTLLIMLNENAIVNPGVDIEKFVIKNIQFVQMPDEMGIYLDSKFGEAIIENCIFNVENPKGVQIVVSGEGNLNFKNNVFDIEVDSNDLSLIGIGGQVTGEINNNILNSINAVENRGNAVINVNSNYWGTNDFSQINNENLQLENIVIADVTVSPSEIMAGESAAVTVDFNKILDLNGDVFNQNYAIPDAVTVSFAANGQFSDDSLTIENGVATTTYTDTTGANDEIVVSMPKQEITKPISVISLGGEVEFNVTDTWVGYSSDLVATLPVESGTATIKVNGRTVATPSFEKGRLTYTIKASDIESGVNTVEVSTNGASGQETFTAYDYDGVVTAETFFDYFDASNSNRLCDHVPKGAVLDFQGDFISTSSVSYIMEINKPINMISTTKDAYINLNTIAQGMQGENPGDRFTVSYNGSGTNISDISFYNSQLWFYNTHNLTINNLTSIVDGREIGSGVGVVAFRANSSHISIKNSYFSTKDNGGHSNFVLTNAHHISVDNSTIKGEGNVGNLIYYNFYNMEGFDGMFMPQIMQLVRQGKLEINDHNSITNCKIYGPETALGICYLFQDQSSGNNVLENNTIVYSGVGVNMGSNGIVKGNNITGGCGINAGAGTQVINNNVSGKVTASGSNVIVGNRIITTENYAIELGSSKNNEIHDNYLVSASGKGDAAVNLGTGSGNVVSDNGPANVDISLIVEKTDFWLPSTNTVTITTDATGTIEIRVNGKTVATETIDNGQVVYTIQSSDIKAGENTVTAFYQGAEESTTFNVYGLVTNETFDDYFDEANSGRIKDFVPEGAVLDFQGKFLSSTDKMFVMEINKPVNIISSTKDAYIDLNTTAGSLMGDNPGDRFTVSNGGSGSNISDLKFHNSQIWVYNAHNVTLDHISNVIEDQRVGSGVGATSIRANSTYVTVKNSYFYTKNNGGSSSLVMAWADYCTFQNNTIEVEGNVGNLIYLTTYNVEVPSGVVANQHNTIVDNTVRRLDGQSAAICWGIVIGGPNNLIKNNTIYYAGGTGINGQYGGTTFTGNVYEGNKLYNAALNALPGSIVKDNYVEGSSMTVAAGSEAYNNTVTGGSLTVNDAVAHDNNAKVVANGESASVYGRVEDLDVKSNVEVTNAIVTGTLRFIGSNSVVSNSTVNNVVFGESRSVKSTNSKLVGSNITGTVTFTQRGSETNSLIGNNITQTVMLQGVNDIVYQNNIITTGDYAVDATHTRASENNISDNYLISNGKTGNAAVTFASGKDHIVENNGPDLVIGTIADVLIGNDNVIPITILPTFRNTTFTVKVNDNVINETQAGGEVNQFVKASDLVLGENTVEVTAYGITKTATFNAFEILIDVTKEITIGDDNSATVTIAGKTGTVSIKLNGNEIATPELSEGSVTQTISADDIVLGENAVEVTYNGFTNSTTFTAAEKAIEIELSVEKTNFWLPNTNTITVSINGAQGNVEIKVNGKTIATPELSEGSVTQTISAEDMKAGDNTVEVSYMGSSKTDSFYVYGLVTNETFFDYFDASNSNRLFDSIPNGATLDFQGRFISDDNVCYNMEINKPINMISSTKDAFINLNTIAGSYMGDNPGNRFTVSYGGSGTNISDISFFNSQLWFFDTHNLTITNLTSVVDNQRIGSGVGVISFRGGSSHIKVKDSYFSTKDNGGSSNFVLANANHISVDNSTIKGMGNVGNLIYLTLINLEGGTPSAAQITASEMNGYNNFTNCKIYGPESPLAICYLYAEQGFGHNLFENNTAVYTGTGVTMGSYGIAKGNNIVGTSLTVGSNGEAYNNTITGSLTANNAYVHDNNVDTIILNGANARFSGEFTNLQVKKDVVVSDLVIAGTLTFTGANSIVSNVTANNVVFGMTGGKATNSKLVNSTVTGTVTFTRSVSDGNALIGNNLTQTVMLQGVNDIVYQNNIITTSNYAVDATNTRASANNISDNYLISNGKTGNAAVTFASGKNHIVENNGPDLVLGTVSDVLMGDDNVIPITILPTFRNTTFTVKVNDKVINETQAGGEVNQIVKASDLVLGENTVEVTAYGITKTATFNAFEILIDVTKEITMGEDNGVTVTIAGKTGTVSIKLNGNEIAAPELSEGSVTQAISASDIVPGENTVEVTYNGFTNSTTFTAKTIESILVELENKNIWLGDENSVTVTIPGAAGTVTIKLNGVEIATPTLSDGSATQTIDADDIIAGENTVEVTYLGFTNSTTFTAQDNVVTPENFDKFFDNDGEIRDIPFDELIFKGEFDAPVEELLIFNPLTITGDGAILKNMRIFIDSDDVKLDKLTIVADEEIGYLIHVDMGSNLDFTNLNVSYSAGADEAVAVDIKDATDVRLLNSTIFFESHVTDDTLPSIAVQVVNSQNVLIDGNNITAKLPCVYVNTYDDDYYLMGSNNVNPIRLKNCGNLILTNNNINSTTNDYSADFPTIQSIYIIGCYDSLIDHNNISMIDEMTPAGMDNYLYGIDFGHNRNVTFSYNNFNMSTSGGLDQHGTAYAFQGVQSDVIIRGNNITSKSNGPNLGIYVASMFGETSELLIEDNFINVTGSASPSGNWALVSGIEIQNGNAKIYNNTIYTQNVIPFEKGAYIYGISYAQWMYGDRSFDIQNNTVYTEGAYTISVINSTSLNVEGNTLYARELAGDDSIDPGITEDVTIGENLPPKPDVVIEIDDCWMGLDNRVNITVAGATGNVTIRVNDKEVAVEQVLVDGTFNFTISASDMIAGENTIEVTYNGLGKEVLPNTNSTTFNVMESMDPELTISVENITSGQSAIVNVAINPEATGVTMVNVNGKLYPVEIDNEGKGQVTIPNLVPGTYTATVIFESDRIEYLSGEDETAFKVAALESKINISIGEALLGDDAVVNVSIPGATGNVTVIVDGKKQNVPLENGNATYTIENITAGDHSVVVVYLGDDNHAPAVESAMVSVDKMTPTVSIDPIDVQYVGNAITITVTNDTAVNVTINGKDYTLSEGVITIENGLSAGEYIVVATAAENDKYYGKSSSTTFTVAKNKSTVNVTAVSEIKTGSETTIAVEVTDGATGIVIVKVGDKEYAIDLSQTNNVTVAFDKAGEYSVVAKYEGDDKYNASESETANVVVSDKEDANVQVEIVSKDDLTVGDEVEIVVKADTNAELIVLVNGKELNPGSNGVLSVSLNNILKSVEQSYKFTAGKAGIYNVTVLARENDEYASEVYSEVFLVGIKNATVEITPITDAKVGDNITIEVTADTDGALTIKVNGEVVSGVYEITKAGSYTITAESAATANYTAGFATYTFVVEEEPAEPENITIVIDGEEYTIPAVNGTTIDTNLTKELNEKIDNLTDELEKAQANATKLADELADAQANATKLAEDLADANAKVDNLTGELADANAKVDNLTGELADANAKVDNLTDALADLADELANATDKIADLTGELADVNAKVDNLTGELADAYQTIEDLLKQLEEAKANATNSTLPETVVVDGVEYPIEYVNGTATVETNNTEPVVPKSSEFSEITISDDLTISIVLKDGDGNVIASVPITYTVNGAANTTVTANDGKFTVKGKNGALITINYAGDANITGTNITLKLNSAAVPEVVKVAAQFNISNRAITINGYAVDGPAGEQGIYYATTLLDANGKPISNVYLEFAVNNKIYNRTTYENGSFNPYKLNMIRAGRYTMAFNFAGDENYTNAFACVCVDLDKKPITIKAPAKTYKAATKTKKYTATLSTIPSVYDGKVYLSPKAVKLTVNGKTFTGKTNSNGQVTFKITNLNKKGKYTATISYKGDKTYEEATQKVKLTIK